MAQTTYTRTGSSTIPIDKILLFVMDKRQEFMVDQVFKKNIALAWMLERKNTNLLSGGDQFLIPMEVGENPSGGWIDEEEGVPMNGYDPTDGAIYTSKECAYNTRLSRKMRRISRGKAQLRNWSAFIEKNTIKTKRKLFEAGLWSNTGGGKIPHGLPYLIPATAEASQTTTIGGVDPAAKSWWRTHYLSMSGISAAANLENYMEEMWDLIEANTGKVDMIFTDYPTKRTYARNQLDFISTGFTKVADFNFETCKYKGAPIAPSDQAPSGEMRFVDNDGIEFCVDPEYWFKWTPWKEQVDNPFTQHRQVLSVCQLARASARNLGCIGAITAA